MSKLSLLITGSRGIIGRHLCTALRQDANVRIIEFNGDIREKKDIEQALITAGDIDVVINLAAIVAVDAVESSPAKAYAVNVGGVTNLLDAIAEAQLKPHFFQCSSAHVYSPSKFPLSEDSVTEPSSEYGRTKRFAEILVEQICTKIGTSWCIGRIFSIHDPSQSGSFLRPRMEERLKVHNPNEPFELHGGESVRDFLTAEKAAAYIAMLSKAKYPGIVNVGSGEPTRISDFVKNLAGRGLNIIPVGQSDTILADISRLREFEAHLARRELKTNG